ncbi:MAG: DUF885 domain-containing protein [Dokdonella sp.]|uniref:DUF885 domain-containing protein n=1 Tax=Dokdonella sp. TaxID=2291710 RepID=UPI0032639703
MIQRFLPLHFALAALLSLSAAPAFADGTDGNARLATLADEFFDSYYFPTNPTIATQDGIHAYDDRLEDYSRAGIDRQVSALQAFETRVSAIDTSTFDPQHRGDRDLLLNTMRGTLLTLQTIRPWEKNPDIYSGGITNSAFVIIERKFASAEERLRKLIAREKQMPAVLQAAKRNLRNPPKIYTEIALEQMPGLIGFFKDDVPAAFADVTDADLKKTFTESNGAVMKALGDYEIWLKTTLLPASKGDFRIGAETYRKKLLFDEMVDTPLARLIEIDLADLRKNQAEFARVAKELDPDKTTAQVLADLAADHPEPGKLLESFRSTFDGLTRFIAEKKIIRIPSTVRPILEETPPFMRATTFASMDTPGPFEASAKEAYFNVTLPEAGWDPKRTAEFMAQFNDPVISNVAVHEAYPGHYVQFLWMHDVKDRVRKLLGAATNSEGWAHYCEQMMLDEGLAQSVFPNDPRQQKLLKLGQLQDALLRNARFYVGIKLHTGEITFGQAIDFFVKEGFQSRAVGLVETKRGTSDPTYLYYTLGKLEILKLRDDVKAKEGAAFTLESFHNRFMQEGFAPIRIVRRAMLKDESPTL